jgi:tRNA-specific 2-thiouridylase
VKGVAPGQSAVFYEGDDVLGGGIIHGSFLEEGRQN